MKKLIIYLILNQVNGKGYVGKTSKSLQARFKMHLQLARKKINRRLYDAINHHGAENFSVELIEECTKDVVNERERFHIADRGTLMPTGYNMTIGGEGGDTLTKWSESERRKLYAEQGRKRRGKRSEEWRNAIQQGAVKREQSKTDEQKATIAAKIRNTLIEKGCAPPSHSTPGELHWAYKEVPIAEILSKIAANWNQKEIATFYGVTSATIWNKLKTTGKSYVEWREQYGLDRNYRRDGLN